MLRRLFGSRQKKDPEKSIDMDQRALDEEGLTMAHFLGIGINKYEHIAPLNNAVKDVQEILKVLLEQYQFEAENAITIFDEEATRSRIYSVFEELRNSLTEKDSLVIYYSGHSYQEMELQTSYWIPVDARRGEVSEYIGSDLLQQQLRALRCQHVFLISDGAIAGALFSKSR